MTSKAYLILNRSVEKNIENIFNSHQIRFRRKKILFGITQELYVII